jgi:CheY-like chemotaxis protein
MSRKIIAVVDDLFFASKIRGTAQAIGVSVTFPRSSDSLIESVSSELPALIVCDLHGTRIDPMVLGVRLKADERLREIPLLGFCSHVEVEIQQRAKEAGFDRVMPRSAFTRDLANILSGQEI